MNQGIKSLIGIAFAIILIFATIGAYSHDKINIYVFIFLIVSTLFYIIIQIIRVRGVIEEEDEDNQIREIQAETFLLILKDTPIARIVLDFYRKYNLPSRISQLLYSHTVRTQLLRGNNNISDHARDYIVQNKVKGSYESSKCINPYNFQNQVFKSEEAVYCYENDPEENIGEEGLLVLHRNYLFFFHSKYFKEEIGILNGIIDFISLFNGFVDDANYFYKKVSESTYPFIPYFDRDKVDNLRLKLEDGEGIAISLISIISAKVVFIQVKKSYCLQLQVKLGHGIKNYWIEKLDIEDISWYEEWIDSISLVQILNGSTNIVDDTWNSGE